MKSRSLSAPANAYRPDVDGLRAVAVLVVIFFHLKWRLFRGGYVGVDVFFVISGYLITRLVEADVRNDTFTLKGFYLRRVRRLMPALLAMSVPVTVAATLLLFPEEMRSFAASLVGQFVSLQNFWFLADGEYFHNADTKLLLHTWSLAVEEQFYLLWPLALLVTRRLGHPTRLVIIAVVLAGSFAMNVAFLRISPKVSFFMFPPRAWELGIGGLLALLQARGVFDDLLSKSVRTALGLAGLGGILASVLLFTQETPFPGKAALLPVFASALVILAGIGGRGEHLVGRLLAHPDVVRIGVISYPMYLWHWPLIVVARRLGKDPGALAVGLVILAWTFALAELTFRFVEQPIRAWRVFSTPRSLVVSTGAIAATLVAFGLHAYVADGAAYRFDGAARRFLTAPLAASGERCGLVFRAIHLDGAVCPIHVEARAPQRVLLWGNSHADMWTELFGDLAAEHHASLYLNARNCRATRDFAFCGNDVQSAVLGFIDREHITDVVLASSWYGSQNLPDAFFERELTAVVDLLATRRALRVWFVIDSPHGKELDPIALFRKSPAAPAFGAIGMATYGPKRERERTFFASLLSRLPKAAIIDPSPSLCDSDECPSGRGSDVWYRDTDHLTHAGARVARDHFVPIFAREPTP